jgi:urease accessory protein
MQPKRGTSVLFALLGVITTPFAQAHVVTTETMGLLSGIAHPLTGADHVFAAVAVGIWAAVSGGVRSVITAFLSMLCLGAVAAFAGGGSLGLVEPVIAVSVITVGALMALRAALPRLVAPAVAGGFALFHGYAHAAGLPVLAGAAWYLFGLLMATSFLLGSGVALGHWLVRSQSRVPLGLAGGFVALIGSLMLAFA